MEAIEQFGIQPLLLVAQIVNFLILLFLLHKFMYKPLLSVMQKRRERIEEGLRNAEEVEKRLQEIAIEREDRLKKASEEAKEIIHDASKSATELIAEARHKATEDIKVMIKKHQEQMQREKDQLYKEIRKEIAGLMVVGLQKVAKKTLNEQDKKVLLKESIEGLI